MANEGTKFQEDFVNSIVNPEISWDRFKDDMSGRRGVANICDYVVYRYPYQVYLELKCYRENTINFKEFSDTQYTGLLGKLDKKGVIPGVLLNYQDHTEVWFLHIEEFARLKQDPLKKSIHIKDCREYGVQLFGERKRTRFRYDLDDFLDRLGSRYGADQSK